MTCVKNPQSRCRGAVVQCEITPPVGIYHRMWGAALHDRATGVHRPLTATMVWLESLDPTSGSPMLLLGLDHCILDTAELDRIRTSIATAIGQPDSTVLVSLSHTHGSGWMSRSRSHLPGGETIAPYLDSLVERVTQLAVQAQQQRVEITIVYGTGRCDLAAARDFRDAESDRYVCGFDPAGFADDTLLVARLIDSAGQTLGTIVNYACHPTTLAWENTLISPDWVGAMREVVEREIGGKCLFLQGASGDLGPREGFVGDVAVADRNGRRVGFAATCALESLPPAGTEFVYTGPVVSGAIIGTWRHQTLPDTDRLSQSAWMWKQITVDLPYRNDLPTIEQTRTERDEWLREEGIARENGDERRLRDCRAQVEQRTRQLTRLEALVPGESYPLTVHLGRMGDALWVFTPGELYQMFQTTLRERLAPHPVMVTTLTNDWQPGYVPPSGTFGKGIYQEVICATAPGALERLIEQVAEALTELTPVPV